MGFVVTIDGPAAAGKSTTARAVAARLDFVYMDTGALYRALAVKISRLGLSPDDIGALEAAAAETRFGLSGNPERPHVLLDGEEVSGEIRTPEVSEMASRLAAHKGVRAVLVKAQRALAKDASVVAEGRDLGTVVFPEADLKVYLDANAETRAARRYRELTRRGIATPLDEVRAEIQRRDERDRTREESPLQVPAGALVLDTSGMTVDQQVEAVLKAVQRVRKAARRGAGPRT